MSSREIERAESLEQLEWVKLLETISAGICHHINNPLATITLNLDLATAELARRDVPLDAGDLARTLTQPLLDAGEAATQIFMLVENLGLTLQPETLKEFDVGTLVDKALGSLSVDDRKRVQIHLDRGRQHHVLAHEINARSALTWLLSTALHHGDPQSIGPIDIRVTADGTNSLSIDVRCSAATVGPWTLDQARARGWKPGLCLVASHRAVRGFGGKLEVAVDGKAVSMHLPLGTTRPRPAPSTPHRERDGARARVLIVDDEPLLGRSMARILGSQFEVVVRANARTALDEIVAGESYDAIVCDLMMDGMSGADFYDALRAHASELAERSIFVTGGAFTPQTQKFVRDTARPVLTKPFMQAQLIEAVKAIVDERTPEIKYGV